jgi:hypothetical protein
VNDFNYLPVYKYSMEMQRQTRHIVGEVGLGLRLRVTRANQGAASTFTTLGMH